MFYILVFIGISLIALGTFTDEKPKSMAVEDLIMLKDRITVLEEALFINTLEVENKLPITDILDDDSFENQSTSIDGFEKYKLLRKYEEENYTIEEISTLLNMNKGEVLLLKNLFKNF